MRLAIFIDLPPAAVTPHNKGHWRTKAEPVKEYRALAAGLGAELVGRLRKQGKPVPLPGQVRVHHTWYLGQTLMEKAAGAKCHVKHRNYRPADEGNAIQALKPAIDGLVDAGLLAGDRAEHVTWGEFTRHSTQKAHGGRSMVELELELLPSPISETDPKP